MPTDPHEEFRELCALSTAGELTEEEGKRLAAHLVHCAACRQLKEQYERVAGTTIPALAAEAGESHADDSQPGAWSIDEAEARLLKTLQHEPAPPPIHLVARGEFLQWNHARRVAAAALILLACSAGGYLIGVSRTRGPSVTTVTHPSVPKAVSRPPLEAARPGPDRPGPSATEEDQVARLLRQAQQSKVELGRLREQLSQLKSDLAQRSSELDRSRADRADLDRQLAQAQADAQGREARLTALGNQAAEATAQTLALKAQIQDLNAAVEAKEHEIAQQQELLERDRDIRNLIGARNLYIAEIYDVAKNGATQKPFGRIFYTKDKSLIFYGYDLDQQKGARKDATFQAWGRSGSDGRHDISLGLLYRDDASQKRWVLKFNDASKIAQLDAVFITVEPEGGSAKPSGKPLLFAYLHLDPNHP